MKITERVQFATTLAPQQISSATNGDAVELNTGRRACAFVAVGAITPTGTLTAHLQTGDGTNWSDAKTKTLGANEQAALEIAAEELSDEHDRVRIRLVPSSGATAYVAGVMLVSDLRSEPASHPASVKLG